MCFFERVQILFAKKIILQTFITIILIHQLFTLLNLSGTIAFGHSITISIMRMRLKVFFLKNHCPVVELGGRIFKNLRNLAMKLPGNSHRQSEYKTAPD